MSELERLRVMLDLMMQLDEHLDYFDFSDGAVEETRRLSDKLRRDIAARLKRRETEAVNRLKAEGQ